MPGPPTIYTASNSPSSGSSPLAVSFTSSVSGSSSWASSAWNFGDGNTSTLQNPTHTYTSAGTYSPSVLIHAANGGSTTISAGTGGLTTITVSTPSLTVTSSQNPSASGSTGASTTLIGTVGGWVGGGGGGYMSFFDGTKSLGTVPVISGVGTLPTTGLTSGGSHSITAVYSGDTNNAGSSSSALTQTITTPPTPGASTASTGSMTLTGFDYPTPFIYTVLTENASDTWTIVHDLHGYPIVDVYVDYFGAPTKILPASVTYTDQNTVTLTFSSARSGYATVV